MRRLYATAACAATLIANGYSAVIYSNMQDPLTYYNFGIEANWCSEMGDLVQFAGTARTLESVTFWMACGVGGGNGGQVDVIYRVRAVDTGTGLPGAILSQANQRITYASSLFKVNLPMPAVQLADQIFITVEMLNGVDRQYGGIVASPVTVGSSDPERWYLNSGAWEARNGGGLGYGNFGIEVHAVPEPASLLVVGLGLTALIRRRR
jgi:hypothetical protein